MDQGSELTPPSQEPSKVARIEPRTETSPKRKENQDSYFINQDKKNFGVFDGVGGHPGGKEASEITSHEFEKALSTLPPYPTEEAVKKALENGSNNSQEAIKNFIEKQKIEKPFAIYKDMATTATVLQVFYKDGKRHAAILQIGNTRAYEIKEDGTLRQLTTDDIPVVRDKSDDLFKFLDEATGPDDPRWNHISETDRRLNWNFKHVITNALSADRNKPKITVVALDPDTKYLLGASDGIFGPLRRSEIEEIVRTNVSNPQEIINKLVDQASVHPEAPEKSTERVKGAQDDKTVVLLKV